MDSQAERDLILSLKQGKFKRKGHESDSSSSSESESEGRPEDSVPDLPENQVIQI